MKLTKGKIFALIAAASFAAVPMASAATCSNASLKGVYGLVGSGLNGSAEPAADITQVTLDGAGNATGTQTKSIDGSIITYTVTGTYQVAANCTGTAAWTNQDDETEHDNFALNNGNNGAFLIQTDAVHVHTGVAAAQGAATCTDAGVKHAFSMQLTGSVISVGQVAMGGQLVLNGSGSITGTSTLSLDGKIVNAVPTKGTYSVGSNCMGTMQITPKGQSPINLALVVVDAGKEIFVVETDTNTIVSGTLLE